MKAPDLIVTPVTAAARAKKQRGRALAAQHGGEGGTPVPGNNYLAPMPKNRAGARPGNRNSWKHGGDSAEAKIRREQVTAKVRQLQRLVDAVLADLEPHRG